MSTTIHNHYQTSSIACCQDNYLIQTQLNYGFCAVNTFMSRWIAFKLLGTSRTNRESEGKICTKSAGERIHQFRLISRTSYIQNSRLLNFNFWYYQVVLYQ